MKLVYNKRTKSFSNTDSIIKDVRDIINKWDNEEDRYGFWKRYVELGDVCDFSYDEKSHLLTAFAYGKAYGNRSRYEAKLTKKDWNEYNSTAQYKRCPWSGKLEPYTTNEHGAIRIAKMLIDKGLEVKDIKLIIEND